MKTDLKSITFEELQDIVCSLGMEKYRAKQIFQWIYKKNISKIEEIKNISKNTKNKLLKTAFITSLEPEKKMFSDDGSIKYLFKTHDNHGIEAVLIPEKKHYTLCISTQVGCPLRCRFCFTGRKGLIRNLTTSEIINQVCFIKKDLEFDEIHPNLVFMGMGEPLLNYENMVKSVNQFFR